MLLKKQLGFFFTKNSHSDGRFYRAICEGISEVDEVYIGARVKCKIR